MGRILELLLAPKVDFELVNAQLDELEVEITSELRTVRSLEAKVRRLQAKRSN